MRPVLYDAAAPHQHEVVQDGARKANATKRADIVGPVCRDGRHFLIRLARWENVLSGRSSGHLGHGRLTVSPQSSNYKWPGPRPPRNPSSDGKKSGTTHPPARETRKGSFYAPNVSFAEDYGSPHFNLFFKNLEIRFLFGRLDQFQALRCGRVIRTWSPILHRDAGLSIQCQKHGIGKLCDRYNSINELFLPPHTPDGRSACCGQIGVINIDSTPGCHNGAPARPIGRIRGLKPVGGRPRSIPSARYRQTNAPLIVATQPQSCEPSVPLLCTTPAVIQYAACWVKTVRHCAVWRSTQQQDALFNRRFFLSGQRYFPAAG